jgi:hypothetical protein
MFAYEFIVVYFETFVNKKTAKNGKTQRNPCNEKKTDATASALYYIEKII